LRGAGHRRVPCFGEGVAPRLSGGPRAASILRTPPGSEGSKGQQALAGARGPLMRERRALVARWEVDRHVSQEGADLQGGADAVRQELTRLREQMAVIKQEAAAEVDRKWGSPFRTQEVFDLKVKARLSGNDKYRSLQNQVQEIEARLAAQSDTTSEADSAR
jgi:hypothetical protein